ncbi:MAG: hypothetical protein JXN10_07930 [Clostridia bacterium]|nr:hypothetical protein [Clostridia bacterium]MBN2883442.1 hypothetical protein [Clostridia bacterium]
MNLFDDVEKKIKQKRSILFSHDSNCLNKLISNIESSNRKTLVMWALECAESMTSNIKDRNHDTDKLEKAIRICRKWAGGELKMPEAKTAILSVHAAAKSVEDKSIAALHHAVGQACSTIHSPVHAPGLIYYELTSLVIDAGYSNYEEFIIRRIEWYSSRLGYWNRELQSESHAWADFLKS